MTNVVFCCFFFFHSFSPQFACRNVNLYLTISQESNVCVQVLRRSQPYGVMSSAVSLPNHTFTLQVISSKQLASIVHILLPETDNCRKGENDSRKYFMICLHERMLPTGRESNPQPDLQSDAHPTESSPRVQCLDIDK